MSVVSRAVTQAPEPGEQEPGQFHRDRPATAGRNQFGGGWRYFRCNWAGPQRRRRAPAMRSRSHSDGMSIGSLAQTNWPTRGASSASTRRPRRPTAIRTASDSWVRPRARQTSWAGGATGERTGGWHSPPSCDPRAPNGPEEGADSFMGDPEKRTRGACRLSCPGTMYRQIALTFDSTVYPGACGRRCPKRTYPSPADNVRPCRARNLMAFYAPHWPI